MSDKSNKYGYVGVDIPAQSFGSNKGVFNPAEINDLVADNKWTSFGQLELIETQTVSGVSVVDFTSIDESTYNVHYLTFNDLDLSNDQENIQVRFSNDGGSTYESSSNYDWAHQRNIASGSFLAVNSTTGTSIEINRLLGNATNETQNGYIYFYNLGDSGKYSFTSSHTTGMYYTGSYISNFGSGVYHQAETINAIRIKESGSGGTFSATMSLYGIRYS